MRASPTTTVPGASPGTTSQQTGFPVLDASGAAISRVRFVAGTGPICFKETLATRGRLTAFFFLRRGRNVSLDLGELLVRGSLSTAWCGNERLWWLHPTGDPPYAAVQPPSIESNAPVIDPAPSLAR